MKKILSFLLMLTLLVSALPVANADGVISLAELVTKQSRWSEEFENLQVDVPTDIEVKASTDSTYIDGPISVEATNVSKIPTFDFRATMYMGVVRDTFETYITLAKMMIGSETYYGAENRPFWLSELANLPIVGGFTIKVYLPAGVTFPEEMLTVGEMYGFNPEAQNAFVDTARTVTTEGDKTVLTVDIKVVDKNAVDEVLRESVLEANLETYLPNLELTCEGVTVPNFGEYTLSGTVEGHTDIGEGENKITTIWYDAVQIELCDEVVIADIPNHPGEGHIEDKPESGIDETVIIGRQFSGDSDPIPVKPAERVKVDYNVAGVIVETQSGAKPYTTYPDKVNPEREGYIFDGWYFDPSYTDKVTDDKVTIEVDTVLYGRWINGTIPPAFVTDDDEHPAYIIGYPEGDVRPLRNINRQEIATVFYRLMNAQTRDSIFTADNNFTDVEKDRWSNKAISTLANGGYLNGYEDGSFRPDAAITRAEFVTIAVRFSPDVTPWENVFTDVEGHWAEESILKAIALGWITGYEDGSFRPDEYITRAEAMTIFNRVLVRYVNEEGLLPDAKYWIDNPSDAWYYYQVEEATNSHTYVRQEDGYNEDWQTIEVNKVWVEKDEYEDAE